MEITAGDDPYSTSNQVSQMFNNATTVEINGGTFVDVARDAYLGQLRGNIQVTAGGDVHLHVAGAVRLAHQSTTTPHQPIVSRRGSLHSQKVAKPILPSSFFDVKTWLKAIRHFLVPLSEKSFRALRRHLDDIDSLRRFSRTLYQYEISESCTVDRIVKRKIEVRLRQCAQKLEDIHRLIAALPCWWILVKKFPYGEAFIEWLTNGHESDELQDVESQLAAEIHSFATCIHSLQCLKDWPWGPEMWCSLTAKSSFSTRLDDFLRVSGPSWIHDIVIEEIIILEPVQGSPWSVPLVFVETLEDIHGFVRTGSRSSISHPYIEGRQYQLDESKTNSEVDENSLTQYLKHKTILEVTIRIRAPAAIERDCCPGCGRLDDVVADAHKEGAWIRCACLKQYCQMSVPQEAESVPSPTPRARKNSLASIISQENVGQETPLMESTFASTDDPKGKDSGATKDVTEDTIPDPSYIPPTVDPLSAFRRLKIENVQAPSVAGVDPKAIDETLGRTTFPVDPVELTPVDPFSPFRIEGEIVSNGKKAIPDQNLRHPQRPKPISGGGRNSRKWISRKWMKQRRPTDNMIKNGKDTDLIVVIMGPTGAGKSTLMNHVAGSTVATAGHALASFTQGIQYHTINNAKAAGFDLVEGQRLVLVDIPGFNDTYIDDSENLRRIAVWLASSYASGMQFGGIIYLHDISATRITGPVHLNVQMLEKICGSKALDKVVIGTTKWSVAGGLDHAALYRLAELKSGYWAGLLEKGARDLRIDNERGSCKRAVNFLLGARSTQRRDRLIPRVLRIQQELVEEEKLVPCTEAGKMLSCSMKVMLKAKKQELAEAKNSEQRGKIQGEIEQLRGQIEDFDTGFFQR
ncbi:hypothetical protein BKA70DRAFT_1152890, partial [Coprinopsis sp. MPI-PUGE-AT-0042]